jgi:hypothetical protein
MGFRMSLHGLGQGIGTGLGRFEEFLELAVLPLLRTCSKQLLVQFYEAFSFYLLVHPISR